MPSQLKKYSLATLFTVLFSLVVALELILFYFSSTGKIKISPAINYIASLAFFLVALLIFLRLVIRPLHSLTDACKKIRSGNLDIRSDIKSRNEIGELTETFNEMIKELRESHAALEEAKDILEIRIQARTHELQELVENQEKTIAERTEELRDRLKNIEETKHRLEEEKNKTLSLITNFTDGLLFFDRKNQLVLANPQFETFFGISHKDIIGKTSESLASFPNLDKISDSLKISAKGIFKKEITAREGLVLELIIVPVIQEDEKIGTMVVLHDITREKLVEKMKTEFVSLAAHQLRTPLSAIKWTMKMLLDNDLGKITEEQRDFIEKVYGSNERMIHLINDLLNVARIEEGRFLYSLNPLQMEEAVSTAIKNLQEKSNKRKVEIIFKKPAKLLPTAFADKEKIEIAITNIIDNSLDYSPNGGKINIKLSADKNEVKFSVKDNGVGIPENQKQRIFSKFFRGENVVRLDTEGTGLGMFITKNIIDAHGGKVWFESKEGKGTTFFFTLPITNTKAK
jgi:PAS domain S-box-containing protein